MGKSKETRRKASGIKVELVRRKTSTMRDENHQENNEWRMQKKNKEKVWRKPSRECVTIFVLYSLG